MAYLAFTESGGASPIFIRNAPGLISSVLGRFNGYTPIVDAVGPVASSLANGTATRFKFRDVRGMSFVFADLPAMATRSPGAGGTVSISGSTATFSVSQDGHLIVGDSITVAGTNYAVTARTSGTVWTLSTTGSASGAAFVLQVVPAERAARLVAHLLDCRTVDVYPEDALAGSFAYTGLQMLPSAPPTLTPQRGSLLRYQLSLSLIRIDGSSTLILVRYT